MLPHQHIFGSLGEIIEYLDYVDANEGAVEHYKRWFFFDRNKMS